MFLFQDSGAPLEARVMDLIGRLTSEEKVGFLPSHQCGVNRLGIAEYGLGQEGAHGIVDREGGKATVFPQPLGLSATWDKALMRKVGEVIGNEARGFYDATQHRSFLNLFFPTIDMERDTRWGRNEEAYGEDPYLAGKLSVELIRGVQGDEPFYVKAVAGPKHFYANNFELDRSFTDSVLTERLREEYYLKVFSYAFREGKALSVMTAYNKINGVPGMINPELNTVLRDKWGSKGYFVTDGGAFGLLLNEHHAFSSFAEGFAAAIKAGMNGFLDHPDMVKSAALAALERGLITETELDAAISPTLRVRMRLGQFDADQSKNPYAAITRDVICSPEHSAITRQASREAVVLLKNDGILPLAREKTGKIAVIGQLGNETMPDWYSGNAPYETTPLAGIGKAFPASTILYTDGCDTCGLYSKKRDAWLRVKSDGSVAIDGTERTRALFRASDWGGGFGFWDIRSKKYLTTTVEGELACTADALWGWFTRELFFCEGDRFIPEIKRLRDADVGVATAQSIYNKPYAEGAVEKVNAVLEELSIVRLHDGLAKAADAAKGADAAVVVIGNHALVGARECIDRDSLDLPARMTALLECVATANPNTILCVVAGYPYALGQQEKRSRAVLFTTHGAQELGTAIGEALAGDFSPAGRLSQTRYETSKGFPDINDYDIIKNKMTYLYTDKPVLHPFGYGLSYTSFTYKDFSALRVRDSVEAALTIQNSGGRDGDEVVQLYLASSRKDTPRPRRQLCGFERLHLKRGEEQRVSFRVPLEEFAYFDERAKTFVVDDAPYTLMVGASSEDIRASEVITL